MADLQEYNKIIQTAIPGESVRDAVISILRIIYNIGGNIDKLDGHDISYFASWVEVDDMLDKFREALVFDEQPTKDSKNLLTAGNIWFACDAVSNILDNLNNRLPAIEDLGENIKAIEKAKQAIWDAIVIQSCGKHKKWDPKAFGNYSDYIKLCTLGSSVQRKTVTISENGHFTSENLEKDQEIPEGTYVGYYEVTTDVKFKTTSLSAKYNDTYDATKQSADGEIIGYNKVTVNVSSGSIGSGRSSGGGGTGASVDQNGIADSFVATENRTYNASEEGVNGWRTVVVKVDDPVIDGTGSYTVTFFDSDETTVIGEPVSGIPYNGSCIGPTPPDKPGMQFVGWEPAPYNIRKDTDCVANYISSQPPSQMEISDSWDQIVACRGMNYSIGQYKTLHLEDGYGDIRMRKVYSGEEFSTSTWVAMDHLAKSIPLNGSMLENFQGWSSSNERYWLNNNFYLNILPENVRAGIVEVPKHTYETNRYYAAKYMATTYDKIWVPSLREILNGSYIGDEIFNWIFEKYIDDANFGGGSYDGCMAEDEGVTYSDMYTTLHVVDSPSPYGVCDVVDKTKTVVNNAAWATRTTLTGLWYGTLAGFNTDGGYNSASMVGMNTNTVIGFCL